MVFSLWIAVAFATLSLATAAAALADRPAPNSRLYQNPNYQFSVKLPKGYLSCVGEITDHGLVVLLDRDARCDGPYDKIRHIDVAADYNTAEVGNTAAALATAECRWQGAKDIVWLHDETISGRKTAGCRRRLGDGQIWVTYIVLRKTGESPLSWIQISADLVTTPARYAADMRVFRQILSGVWVHPDGPHY